MNSFCRLTLCGYAHIVCGMNYQQAQARADILKALAHPVRVLIVNMLTDGDRCVCELNALADIDQSNISRHLAILKKAGILTDRRNGMKVFYHLQTPCILRAFECAVEVVRTDTKRRNEHLKAV
jgi:ArsR family transcriptional regulator, arsenate/arsenite/antimonite-responsive transcriptional repressor